MMDLLPLATAAMACALGGALLLWRRRATKKPRAANFHFTRVCNYQCGFCFHTELTGHVLPLEDAKKVITELHSAGFRKINFAGGEPFTKPKMLGEMCKYAKSLVPRMTVSIISNGSLIKSDWFDQYAQYVDILGISCDSAVEATNRAIGRRLRVEAVVLAKPPRFTQLDFARHAATLCRQHNIVFKLNSVVCAQNADEDMSAFVAELNPARWKLFEVLPLAGENTGPDAKRDVTPFLLPSPSPFGAFVERHKAGLAALRSPVVVVPEDNATMQDSYVLVDEYGRFLSSTGGTKGVLSKPLHVVGGAAALAELTAATGAYDDVAFRRRDGDYYERLPSGCASLASSSSAAGGLTDMEDIGGVLAARRGSGATAVPVAE